MVHICWYMYKWSETELSWQYTLNLETRQTICVKSDVDRNCSHWRILNKS